MRWEDVAALAPAFPSGAGPVAEQCELKMHVSLWTRAVSFGSVTSVLQRYRDACA